MHKEKDITLVDIVRRLNDYLQHPPAEQALGYRHFGYSGRVGTKKHRKMLRKLLREEKAKLKRVK
jgi:hypothetical protein